MTDEPTQIPEPLTGKEMARRCNEIFQGQQLDVIGEVIINLVCDYLFYCKPSAEEEQNFYDKIGETVKQGVEERRALAESKAAAKAQSLN